MKMNKPMKSAVPQDSALKETCLCGHTSYAISETTNVRYCLKCQRAWNPLSPAEIKLQQAMKQIEELKSELAVLKAK